MATAYDSLKVTELREELKRRNIPTTKLSRKQDIIDRLVEDDNSKSAEGAEIAEAIPETSNGEVQEPETVSEGEDSTTQAEVSGTALEGTAGIGAPNGDGDTIVDTVDQQEARTELASAKVVAPEVSQGPISEQNEQPPADAAFIEVPQPLPSKESVDEQPTVATTPPDDSKKRKRRSVTPSLSRDSISKKLKETDEDAALWRKR